MNKYRLRIEMRRAYTLAHIAAYVADTLIPLIDEEAVMDRMMDILDEWRELSIRHFKQCGIAAVFPAWDTTTSNRRLNS